MSRFEGAAAPVASRRGGRLRAVLAPFERLAGRLPWIKLAVAGGLGWGAVELAASAHAYATSAPRFEARRLEFSPTPHVDAATVRRLLGLEHGRNLLSVDLPELARKVAEHPWVARAEVVRRLPDTLVVEVEEYEPVALLAAGELFLVDAEGRPFKKREAGEGVGLPIVTGIDPSRVFAGDEPDPALVRALEAIEAYVAEPRPPLGEVHVEPDGDLVLYTAVRGTQLRLGRGPVAPALERYDALRAALGQRSDRLARVALDAAPRDGEAWVAASFLAPSYGTARPPDAAAERSADTEQNVPN